MQGPSVCWRTDHSVEYRLEASGHEAFGRYVRGGGGAYSTRDIMTLEIGQLVDNKYRINRQIGEGGMGAVYEGENVRINRRVAIKVLHAAFTGNSEVMARFEREAQAAGRIGNDHILEVLDLGALGDGDHSHRDGVSGRESLSQRIKRLGRLNAHQLAPIMRQVLVGPRAPRTPPASSTATSSRTTSSS